MARRRPSKHTRAPRPLDRARHSRREHKASGVFLVRDVPGERATKTYRCPGCDNVISPGSAHIVAWPEEPDLFSSSGLELRRHWHKHCWKIYP